MCLQIGPSLQNQVEHVFELARGENRRDPLPQYFPGWITERKDVDAADVVDVVGGDRAIREVLEVLDQHVFYGLGIPEYEKGFVEHVKTDELFVTTLQVQIPQVISQWFPREQALEKVPEHVGSRRALDSTFFPIVVIFGDEYVN